MIDVILNLIGIILQVYSVFLCCQITKIIENKDSKKSWNFLCSLIIFFLIGYSFNFYFLITPNHPNFKKDFLVSLIFFFGAIFVAVVLNISKKQIVMLKNDKLELELKNKELTKISEKLKIEHNDLEEAKTKIEKINNHLKNNLDEFYSLKLDKKIKKNNIIK